ETPPQHGTLVYHSVDGRFVYRAADGYTGTDTFTYRARAGSSYSGLATVTIHVGQDHAAPQAVNDSYPVSHGRTSRLANDSGKLSVVSPTLAGALQGGRLIVAPWNGVLANGTDTHGSGLTAVLVGGPQNGQLTFGTAGSFEYTPNVGLV